MAKKKNSNKPYRNQKSRKSRIIVLILAIALALGILMLPLQQFFISVFAEESGGASIVVKEFAPGKLSEALLEAADGTDYNYITKAAVLSGTMTAADYSALLSIPNLEYIELAGTETENGIIPENAIPSRNQLTYLSLPKNTVEIGNFAFSGNRKLEKISMPATVTKIGAYAFDACEALVSVPITANVTYIGEGAFRDCKAITKFTIPAGVTDIFPYTFSKCGFSEMIIGPDVSFIGDGAFADCHELKDIYSYAKEAPSIQSADAFRNVSASVHVYDGCAESYKSWEGNNIKASEDLTGDYPVETAADAPMGTGDKPQPAPEQETVLPQETGPDKAEAEAPAETAAAQTQAVTAAPAQQQSGSGVSVGIVIVIAVMAAIIAVLATVLVMTRKKK